MGDFGGLEQHFSRKKAWFNVSNKNPMDAAKCMYVCDEGTVQIKLILIAKLHHLPFIF